MIHLPNQQAHFVHIPKTGGDFVTRFLLSNVPGARHESGGKHWPAAKHGINPRFQFAFVREPVAWFRSYYAFITRHYIIPNGKYPIFEGGMWHCMRCFEKYDYTSFGSFIDSVYDDQPSYYTRMIEWFTGPPDAHYMNFIGKQENLNDELGSVLKRLKLYHLVPKLLTAKPINTSPSKFPIDPVYGFLIESQESAIYDRFGYTKTYHE